MTKAEKIFKDTYTECRLHAKAWGFERQADGRAIGFNRLATEEATCRRTFNAIQKLIDKEAKNIELNKRLLGEDDYTARCEFALEMVQETLNNAIRNEEEFQKWLKEPLGGTATCPILS